VITVAGHCVTSSSHLFPSPPIQAAAVGREGGADSTSHMPGKRELKGPSHQYVSVCLGECMNTIDMKLQPSVGR